MFKIFPYEGTYLDLERSTEYRYASSSQILIQVLAAVMY